jgi:hypothetical protein
MVKLDEVIAANTLLVSLGAEDALPRIASVAIERSLELQSRVDRALGYAAQTPPSSMHARNMARILDGSITHEDELRELAAERTAEPVVESVVKRKVRGPGKKTSGRGSYARPQGLKGRSTKERKEFRDWLKEQGIDLPQYGPVPQEHVDAFDLAREELRRMRREGLKSA